MDKASIRRLMANVLADVDDRLMRSVQLWSDLAERGEYTAAHTVMAFASLPAEPDTDGLLARLQRDGKRIVLPRVEPSGLVAVEDGHGSRRGQFGIREPLGDPIDPTTIDVIIVPGVAFTADGWRLGHGKGYYDRFLPTAANAATIGVCFAEQLFDALPTSPNDVRLGLVLSC